MLVNISRCVATAITSAILITSSYAESAPWVCDRSDLLVTNVRLFDGDKVSILISDGRIKKIGEAAGENRRDLRIVDGKGALALPGLIDSHTHFDALPAAKHLQREMDAQLEIFPVTMRQTLASGVTTARTHLAALADLTVMTALGDDDCFPAPRFALSGPGLLGGAPDVNGRLMRGVADAEDAVAKTNEMAGLGANWLALHGIANFSEGELFAIFSAADENSMKVMADTDGFENLAAALNWPVLSGEYINRSPATDYPPEIIAALSAKDDFYVTPPLGYYMRSAAIAADDNTNLDPDLFEFTPDDLAEEMKRSFREAFDRDDYIARAVEAAPTYRQKFRQLIDAGAKPVIGSDTGSLGQFHRDAVWIEMAAWARLGIAPEDILAGATVTPAEMLGMNDVGVLKTGARGDLVLYAGDLDAGEFHRAHVAAVIKGGVFYVRDGVWVGPDTEETRAGIEAAAAVER